MSQPKSAAARLLEHPKVQEIWEEVKRNQARLEGCDRPHRFEPQDESPHHKDFICRRCGGTLDRMQARWYQRGLEDAPKAPGGSHGR